MTTPGLTDEELTKMILEGDMNAFETFIGRYQRQLFNFIYNMSNSYVLSEDVVQEAFIKFYKNIKKMRYYSSVKSFLFTLARNLLIDKKRKIKFKEVPLESAGTQAARVDDGLLARSLEEFLSSLSEIEKAIALLFFRYGFTHKEIADSMGIPIGTVKSRLFNLVRKLREEVNERL